MAGMRRKPRVIFNEEQLQALMDLWEKTNYPDAYDCEELASKLQLSRVEVQVWFKNQRQRVKKEKEKLQSRSAPVPQYHEGSMGVPGFPLDSPHSLPSTSGSASPLGMGASQAFYGLLSPRITSSELCEPLKMEEQSALIGKAQKPSPSSGAQQPTLSSGSSQPIPSSGAQQPARIIGSRFVRNLKLKRKFATQVIQQPALSPGSSQPVSSSGAQQPTLSSGSSQPIPSSGAQQPARIIGSRFVRNLKLKRKFATQATQQQDPSGH